eukprot:CAMPEP_0185018718 /NCGR_PEP_ID=MMETSP1103-20130426/1390_1 /TAXON_ID=36769 /ORGANISM="Paraphysomonas bandaiensis, Strain Caron Lab Isolate" /LENGTH=300 /DNA_ID=CAMNT_0027548655 /DNA_START=60 /DNA_END=962 /DNA_ORIENTATION=-
MTEPDELYTMRNLFWLGNYQLAINESNSLHRLAKHLNPIRDEFVYRSYLALGQYDIVIGEIQDTPSTPLALRAIRQLALYLSKKSSYEVVLSNLEALADEASKTSQATIYYLVLATVHVHGDNIKDALIATEGQSTLELSAYAVQLLLRMDRPDLAQQRLALMKSVDEDSALTQLATAWVSMRTGGAKGMAEAANIYEDLSEKYGASVMLMTGLAVSKMHQGLFDEAETHLQEALNKDPSNADCLANIITVSYHLDKPPEVIARFVSQLRNKAPEHPLLQGLTNFESAYDRVTAQLAGGN